LEFRAVSVQQFGELSVDGFFCPGDEASPVIFEMFPDDLDQVELGTVRRQIEEERFVFNEPAIQRSLVDAVMASAGLAKAGVLRKATLIERFA
jgi:hypothetical protein